MNWQDMTEQQQQSEAARNGSRLREALQTLGLRITGAGWMTSGYDRRKAAEALKVIDSAGMLSERMSEDVDCHAADLRRRFGL